MRAACFLCQELREKTFVRLKLAEKHDTLNRIVSRQNRRGCPLSAKGGPKRGIAALRGCILFSPVMQRLWHMHGCGASFEEKREWQ